MSVLLNWVNLVVSGSYTKHFIAHFLRKSIVYQTFTKQTFLPYNIRIQTSLMWDISHIQIWYNSISRPKAKIFYRFVFFLISGPLPLYQGCFFPRCLPVLLPHDSQMILLKVLFFQGFPDYKIEKWCPQSSHSLTQCFHHSTFPTRNFITDVFI